MYYTSLYRYAGQACIIGQSNLSRKQVDRLVEDSTEDAVVSDTLKNTDVLLSLNKKQRWRLPSTLSHMIRAGDFSQDKAVVSLLERHKLKRRANCVGFACSKQTTGSGQDVQENVNLGDSILGQKRYFSFNINSFEHDESRRKWKKRMAEQRTKLAQQKKKIQKDRRTDMKTVDVMTVEGGRLDSQAVRRPTLPGSKPGYTVEVFYPCPQSCSLTFNPKYTDVVMTQNDDGEMEVRSNVKSEKKSQRKHRRKFTGLDLSAINTEARYHEEDVEEMWREEYEDNDGGVQILSAEDVNQLETLASDQADCEREEKLDNDFSESVWACLVDQAERARAQWNRVSHKPRQRRRSGFHGGEKGSKRTDSITLHDKTDASDDDKAHVFYIEKEENLFKTQRKSKTVSNTKTASVSDKRSHVPNTDPVLSSAPAILSIAEVSPESLKSRFGDFYSEAKCRPRRFCINITDDVANLLSVYRSVDASAAYTTFLVFTSAGLYDVGMATYAVSVNCAACPVSENITANLPREATNLDSIVNIVVGNLLDLKDAGKLNMVEDFAPKRNIRAAAFDPLREMMMEKMKLEIDTFYTSDRFDWNRRNEGLHEDTNTETDRDTFSQNLLELAADSEMDIFCDICYDSVNPTHIDSAPGTELTECGHLFCDSCWRAHLRTRFREGALQMTCAGYQCETKLETSTMLSLLHVTEVIQIVRRNLEEEVESCPTAKWCPSPGCGKVIRLRTKSSDSESNPNQSMPDASLNFDVTCSCGNSWCFNCLAPAHWPARCEQAQDYLDKLSSIKPINEGTDDEPKTASLITKPQHKPPKVVEVEGRLCPRCRKFIQKNGGCPHMVCRCGYAFCWSCLGPWNGHPSRCYPDAAKIYNHSLRLKVHHMTAPTGIAVAEEEKNKEKDQAQPKPPSRKQKASMYQRALQQRTDEVKDTSWLKPAEQLAHKICKAAGKDLEFKREVLRQCGVPESHIPGLPKKDELVKDCDLLRMPLADHVMRYLKSAREARSALRRTIEYTYVLLQDFPNTMDKRRALRVASDLTAFCSFSLSVLHAGGNQDPRVALHRLADIQTWSSRTLDALMAAVLRLKG
ncbi:E3 ubiquitin-protein ligase ARIH1 [Elysia marginata]|uniref:RBR-type E3 ubiquitin transferase n=1 Tax=Elysia marginata TaxID=1093978 RepID=A0AAV4ITQ5_9GAST|nr:E3 ubiquitin-protein ligase ARIH1 [Elysia marginata]